MADQKLTVISGKVSAMDRSYSNVIRFRIDNRPVNCYMQPNIAEGDVVKVVIEDKTEPTIIALRNESTKVYYGPAIAEPKFNVGMLIFGIFTIPLIGVGFLIIWMAIDGYRGQFGLREYGIKVKKMLEG